MSEDGTTAPDESGNSPAAPAEEPPAVEQASTTSPEPGTKGGPSAEKGGSRRGLTVALWIMAGIVLVAAAVIAGIAFRQTSIRRTASEDLSRASRLVERADETVVAVDEIVRASIDATVGQEATSLLGEVEAASDDLDAAIAIIGDVKDDLAADEAEQAEALRESAEARLRMLEYATPILDASAKVAASLGPADTAMEVLVEAETLSDRAVKEYNKLTKASVKKSKELATQSEDKVKEAKEHFAEAETAYPSADFASYVAYCDEKIEVLALSKKADDAFLANKPEDANEYSDEFNAAERKLVDQAKKLPESVRTVISEAYENDVAKVSAAYSQARAEAAEADGRYRELTGE